LLLPLLLLKEHAYQLQIVTDRPHHSRSPDIPLHLMLSIRRRVRLGRLDGGNHTSPERLSWTETTPSIRAPRQIKANFALFLSAL